MWAEVICSEVVEDDWGGGGMSGGMESSFCADYSPAYRGVGTRNMKSAKKGVSSSARISKGTVHGSYTKINIPDFKRDDSQHITITVILYNTVVGGVPTKDDVVAAVTELESLYADLKQSRLSETPFMLDTAVQPKDIKFMNRTTFPVS